MLASRMGHEALVDWLLAEGAAPSIQMGPQNQTAIHLALEHTHMNCVHYLLESEANPNLRDSLGRTPLHYTIHTDSNHFTTDTRRQAIELLIKHGANPNITDLEGATPLHYSVIYNRTECIAPLISLGANPDAQTYEYKLTPCHIALIEDLEDAMRALIAAGASPDIANAQGWTVRTRMPKRWNIALDPALELPRKAEPIFSTNATRLRKTQKVANSSTHS